MKYKAVLAYDVPCYHTVEIEAGSPEEADKIAEKQMDNIDLGLFEPDWGWTYEPRVVEGKEIEEKANASDQPREESSPGL